MDSFWCSSPTWRILTYQLPEEWVRSISRPEVVRGDQNLALDVFGVYFLCCSIFRSGCMFASVVFGLVSQYKAKRLAGKNVSEMTCFVSGGT